MIHHTKIMISGVTYKSQVDNDLIAGVNDTSH